MSEVRILSGVPSGRVYGTRPFSLSRNGEHPDRLRFAVEIEPPIVYPVIMIFIRFILLLVLAYYLLKLFIRWILGISDGRKTRNAGASYRSGSRSYSELTDQEIEDADYEEIVTEDK